MGRYNTAFTGVTLMVLVGLGVSAGGSEFPTVQQLLDELSESGWVTVEHTPVSLAPSTSWTEAADRVGPPPEADEAAVADAIDRGEIAPALVVASR